MEIELKLHVPAARVPEVRAAVVGDGGSAGRVHLQATYLDSDDHALATAGMGWRLRKENRQWVQTLKATMADGDGMRRAEHNVPRKGTRRPEADAALHAGTEAGDRLAEVLATGAAVREQFSTDVWRDTRRVRVTGGTVELAFDLGLITSGDRSLEVSELEIELVRGSAAAVIAAAKRWAPRHGLWLDAATKAQRGNMLAAGAEQLGVARAPKATLDPAMSVDAALREMTRVCMIQVLGNASAIAAGLGGPEHIHQARVGIRKLRTVLGEFGRRCPSVDPTWRDDLADVFEVLGASRDREVVIGGWLKALADKGAPPLPLPPVEGQDPGELLRTVDTTTLFLDLLAYAYGEPDEEGDEPLVDVVAGVLQRLRKHSVKRADVFRRLAIEEQHEVRKELKRLRYVAELTSSLFGRKKVERYIRTLEPAQDALGHLNDLAVATEVFGELAATDPNAWFAVGWLKSRHDRTVKDCVKPLRQARDAKRFW